MLTFFPGQNIRLQCLNKLPIARGHVFSPQKITFLCVVLCCSIIMSVYRLFFLIDFFIQWHLVMIVTKTIVPLWQMTNYAITFQKGTLYKTSCIKDPYCS